MPIWMLAFGVLLNFVVFTLIAGAIALVSGLITWFASKKHKKRNTILAVISPFVFVYVCYFFSLVSAFACSAIFGTGCGFDGYYHADLPGGYELQSIDDDFGSDGCLLGRITKEGNTVVGNVSMIRVSGDSVCGQWRNGVERTNFVLDTALGTFESGSSSENECFMEVESFYYDSWPWVGPAIILSLFIPAVLVFIIIFITVKIFK